jgi:hypothetical protein
MLPGTELPSCGPSPICVSHISSTLFHLDIVIPIVVTVDLVKEGLPSVLSFSRRFLSMCRCLVTIVNDIPRRGFRSSCLHVLNSSRWSYIVIRSQTLSIVSSHERASASPTSSSLEVHSQSFMALSRSFFII